MSDAAKVDGLPPGFIQSEDMTEMIQAIRTLQKKWPKDKRKHIGTALIAVDTTGRMYITYSPGVDIVPLLKAAHDQEALGAVRAAHFVGDNGVREMTATELLEERLNTPKRD